MINIPAGAVYRQESSDDFGTVITYKKDGKLYRGDGPAQIRIYNEGYSKEYYWHEGRGIDNPYQIIVFRKPGNYLCRAYFNKGIYPYCDKCIDWCPLSGIAYYHCIERGYKKLENRSQQWFEQEIGMTLEQLHSFR